MDEKGIMEDLEHLGAENAALQTLVIGLLQELAAGGNKQLVERAFHRAEEALEIAVVAMGKKAPAGYSRLTVEILEQFRRMSGVDD